MISTPASPHLLDAQDPDAHLREALKRCPAFTLEAALRFRASGDPSHLVPLVNGVVARFVEPDLRPRLQDPPESLRMAEDLGLDSLTMMEIVLLAEDVLQICIAAEELRHFHTIGDVHQFVRWKATGDSASIAAALATA